jgi:curved DNA-binding protein CbpA
MADPLDPYKILQVDSEAEDEVIQAAYRRLARKYHPDLAKDPDAADRMARINAAWEVIGDPAGRAAYDERRIWGLASGDGSAPGGAGESGQSGSSDPANAGRPGGAGGSAGGAPTGRATAPETPGTGARPADGRGAGSGSAGSSGGPARPEAAPPPETVSRDWTSGRSSQGGGYTDSMRTKEGEGAAGPPPGRPSGSVLNFGRYSGWSLGEVARHDLEYLEWLDRAPIGRNYRQELDAILRSTGRRRSADPADTDRRGLYRRR